MRPGEQEVLAAQSYVADLSLAQVIVEAELSVVEEARERGPLVEDVARGFGQVAARGLVGQRADDPALELVELGPGTLPSKRGPLLVREVLEIGEPLDTVQARDGIGRIASLIWRA